MSAGTTVDDDDACTRCRRHVPTRQATFLIVVSLLVVSLFPRHKGNFCRGCSEHIFRTVAGSCLLLGWWSPFAAFLMPIAAMMNLGAFYNSRWLPDRNDDEPRHPRAAPIFAVAVALTLVSCPLVFFAVRLLLGAYGGAREASAWQWLLGFVLVVMGGTLGLAAMISFHHARRAYRGITV